MSRASLASPPKSTCDRARLLLLLLLLLIASSSNPDFDDSSPDRRYRQLMDGCRTDGWMQLVLTGEEVGGSVLFFSFFPGGVRQTGEGGGKRRQTSTRLTCFSTKSHDLQTQGGITGLVTDRVTLGRQFREGDGGKWRTVWQTERHLVASAGNGDWIYG